MNSPKNGDIFYNSRDKQFVFFSSNKKDMDSGISCILSMRGSMRGQIETLSMPEKYLEEIRKNEESIWVHVGNLTTIFRNCI